MRRAAAALMTVLLGGLATVAQEKPSPAVQRLQGDWGWDSAEKQSDAVPRILVERVVIKGDTLTIHYIFGDQRFTSASKFTLDATATPPTMDFTPIEGTNKGKTYLCRYEIRDGKLKICYRGPGSTRPKDFSDKNAGNDGTTFLHLKKPAVTS